MSTCASPPSQRQQNNVVAWRHRPHAAGDEERRVANWRLIHTGIKSAGVGRRNGVFTCETPVINLYAVSPTFFTSSPRVYRPGQAVLYRKRLPIPLWASCVACTTFFVSQYSFLDSGSCQPLIWISAPSHVLLYPGSLNLGRRIAARDLCPRSFRLRSNVEAAAEVGDMQAAEKAGLRWGRGCRGVDGEAVRALCQLGAGRHAEERLTQEAVHL